jgi:hypothetical protein
MVEAGLMPRAYNIPFDAGMHQDIDPGVAREGVLTRILNGRVPRQGGIVKALETVAVSAAVEPSGGSEPFGDERPHCAATANGREVIAVSGRAYQRDAETRPSWTESGRVSRYLPRKAHFLALDETAAATILEGPHVAALGDFVCAVYTETEDTEPQVVITLLDPAGVRRFAYKVPLSSGNGAYNARVIAVGAVFCICYVERGTGVVQLRVLDPSAGTLAAGVVIGTVADLADRFDAAAWNGTSFLFAWRNTTTNLRVRIVDTAGVTVLTGDFAVPNEIINNIVVFGTPGESVHLTWIDASVTVGRLIAFAPDLSSSTGLSGYGTDVEYFGFARRDATTVWLVYQEVGAGSPVTPSLRFQVRDAAGAVLVGNEYVLWGMRIASHPFDGADGARVSIWAYPQLGPQAPNGLSSLTLRFWLLTVNLDADNSDDFPWVNAELSSDLLANGNFHASSAASGVWRPQGPVASRGERHYFAAVNRLGIEYPAFYLYDYEDVSTRRGAWRQALQVPGGGTVLAGGHLQELPSDRIIALATNPAPRGFENGWIRGPRIQGSSLPAGTIPAGTYQVAVTYEMIDVDGRRHRSEVHYQTFTLSGAQALTLEIYTALRSEREFSTSQQRGSITVYMTLANGTTFYRASAPIGAVPSVFPPNTAATDPVATVAITSDPDATNEQVYTAGGEFANAPAPSHRFALSADSRLHLAGLWDPSLTEVSKFIATNEPPCFTRADNFRVRWPFDVSALAELDGLTLALGVDGLATCPSIWPDDRGVPGAPEPTLLSSTGIRDEDAVMSILRIPNGVLFQGDRGIYLVPRGGGEPEFLGAPIQAETFTVFAVAPFSEAADANAPASRLVAFALFDATGTRWVAMLDQDTLQWVSLDTATVATEVLGEWGSDLVQIPLNDGQGTIRRTGTSRATLLPLSAETAWARPFGPLGSGYVRRAMLVLTVLDAAAPITLEFARDGASFSALAPLTPQATGIQRLEWQLPGDQVTTAVRFRASVSAPGVTPSAGSIFHGIACEVDAVDGLARITTGARA